MGMMSSLSPSLSLSPCLILTLTQGFSSVQDIKRKMDNKTANARPAPEMLGIHDSVWLRWSQISW